MTLMSGQKLLHYRILDQIGAGGMGVVYRAHDERLDREVALKVLPAGDLADDTARKRFREEALALSHLNHPNVCTIYEIGEDDGQTFIVMEYVKGGSLSTLVRSGGLPAETVYRYGSQIADALAHAHDHGLLHRDLKSGNVMVTPEGRIKVLDFGLAKRMHQSDPQTVTQTKDALTEAGTVLGTLQYMAPETLRGDPADARSDIWALGAVLYEMTSGALPFRGQTPFAVSSAILNDAPAEMPASVPAGLRSVIQRCLVKDQGQRYQTAAEVRAVLEAAPSTASAAVVKPVGASRSRWALAAIGALALLAAALIGLNAGRIRDRLAGKAGPPRIESIAVLPLDNFSHDPEQEFFADGMTEQLIADLSKIRALRVISRTSVMQYKGKSKPLPEIARELNVDAVVEGSVLRSGNKVRITAQLLYAPKDQHLWAESYERDLRDVLAMQGEVARDVANQIRITVTPQEQIRLGSRRQVDPEVYQLTLRGQYYSKRGTLAETERGIQYFQQAIEKDGTYAPAHAGLAFAYSSLTPDHSSPREVMPRAKAEALRAIELDETLSEAHTALAVVRMYYDWDWIAAERELRRAIELNPSSADAHDQYGNYFCALAQFEPSIAESRRARDLDPLSVVIYFDLLTNLVSSRRYDETIEECRRGIDRDPNFSFGYAVMGMAYSQKGQFPEAIAALEKAIQLDPNWHGELFLAHVRAAAGDKAEARKILSKVEALSRKQYVCAYEIATVHVTLGDNDTAYKWMQKGVKEQCDCLVWLKSEPWMDSFRSHPRYLELLKRVGLADTETTGAAKLATPPAR